MADKEKRLRKILAKRAWKGRLKPVGTLEEAHIVLLEDRQCINKSMLLERDAYRQKIEEGYMFPEDQIHYLISTNPRNVRNIEDQFASNSYGLFKLRLT